MTHLYLAPDSTDDLMDLADAVGVVKPSTTAADLPIPFMLTTAALSLIDVCEMCSDSGIAIIRCALTGDNVGVTCPLCGDDR